MITGQTLSNVFRPIFYARPDIVRLRHVGEDSGVGLEAEVLEYAFQKSAFVEIDFLVTLQQDAVEIQVVDIPLQFPQIPRSGADHVLVNLEV